MKQFIIFLLVFFTVNLQSQKLDTISINEEIDSLVNLNRDFIGKNSFDEAFETIKKAKKKALISYGENSIKYAYTLFNEGRTLQISGGDFSDIESLYLQSKTIYESFENIKSSDYTTLLHNLGILYYRNGDYLKVEPIFKKEVSILKEVSGIESLKYSEAIGNLASLYMLMERYQESEDIFLNLLNTYKNGLDTNSVVYAGLLHNVGLYYYNIERFSKAEFFFERSIYLKKKLQIDNTLEYCTTLGNLAIVYSAKGEYKKAELLILRSNQVLENVDNNTFQFIINYVNLGKLYWILGDFSKAESYYLKAKSDVQTHLGKKHPYYASIINHMGAMFQELARFDEAEKLTLEAIEIRKKNHSLKDYARSLHALAGLYQKKGDYKNSKDNFEKVIKILESTEKFYGLHYAEVLNDFSILCKDMGKFEKAEALNIKSLKIKKETLGDDNIHYAYGLNNLAILYSGIGNYEKAKDYHIKALNIIKKTYGENHVDYASVIDNLGGIYLREKKYSKAESLFKEAISIKNQIYGDNNPNINISINNLAIVYQNTERYKESETLFLKALKIDEDNYGKVHPEYALTLYNLGVLYEEMKNFSKAKDIFINTLTIQKKTVGLEHPDYMETLSSLIGVYLKTKEIDKSIPMLKILFNSLKSRISSAFSYMSNTEKNIFIKSELQPFIDIIQSSVYFSNSEEILEIQYNMALLLKGMQLEADKNTIKYILENNDSLAAKSYNEFLALKRQLKTQLESPVSERRNIKVIKNKIEVLEKELARLSSNFRSNLESSKVTLGDVKNKLKSDEAAIEFIRINFKDPDQSDSIFYAAIVVSPKLDQVKFIHLFEEKELNILLSSRGERRLDYVDNLYSFNDRGFSRDNKEKNLYTLIWEPIDSIFKDVNTIYFSPTGLLNRINLSAIPVSDEKTLSDKFKLYSLLSTKSLVSNQDKLIENKTAKLYGGIQYEYDSVEIAKSLYINGSKELAYEEKIEFETIDRSFKKGKWKYLKWTEKEVDNISSILKKSDFSIVVNRQYQATEESFKKIGVESQSPVILHLATHGFFFPDPENSSTKNGIIFKASNHPMLRSGLLMSGANRAWQGDETISYQEDGILTAYEISQMNLTHTELVVLSACETGLGDIKGNEGVFGLQRAFKMAGVKYLIMSLWQVPDVQTKELMIEFYKKWLEDKKSIPDAFNAAQKEMREKYINPYFWAGFVLLR